MDQLAFNEDLIEKFRAGLALEGLHRERIVLLTTTGRHSGERHTAPMMFHRDADGAPIVIASNDGAPRHPSWFLNLVANPRVTVELPDESYDSVAVPLDGTDYDTLWAEILAAYPFFVDQQRRAGARRIPLVRLARP